MAETSSLLLPSLRFCIFALLVSVSHIAAPDYPPANLRTFSGARAPCTTRVDAVLIEQVDRFPLQPLERSVDDLPDVLGAAVEAASPLAVGIDLESELCCDHHAVPEGSERFTHQLLVHEGTVSLGRVEERDASLDRGPDQ